MEFPESLFDKLPQEAADGYRCLDVDDGGEIQIERECVGGHERVLFLPKAWTDGPGAPFQWVMFNWNPMGHGPEGIWDIPHFDFHFFIQSLSDRNRIRIGKCALLVDCDDLEAGTAPVPAKYLPPRYEDRGVVEFGMGNHLIDPQTFGSPARAPTHTLIYGAWAAQVSFLEPMITRQYLEDVASGAAEGGCHDLPRPDAVDVAGFYPGVYCIRYRPAVAGFRISLERFSYRDRDVGMND